MEHYQSLGGGKTEEQDWRVVAPRYREILFHDGEERHEEDAASGEVRVARQGMTREEVESILERGGKLRVTAMVRCRVRAFSDGAVIGTRKFLEEFFSARRDFFGPKRRKGARPIYGCETELCAARGLRKNALG